MKRLIIIFFSIISAVAIYATAYQHRPFENADMSRKVQTVVTTSQYRPFDNTDVPGKFQIYQRQSRKNAIKIKTVPQNIKLRNGNSYDVLMNRNEYESINRVHLSQQNVQYYNYRENISASASNRVEYKNHIAMKMQYNKSEEIFQNDPFIEIGSFQAVGVDTNPPDAWGEVVPDVDDDVDEGPMGDVIIPMLLFALLWVIKRRNL